MKYHYTIVFDYDVGYMSFGVVMHEQADLFYIVQSWFGASFL